MENKKSGVALELNVKWNR